MSRVSIERVEKGISHWCAQLRHVGQSKSREVIGGTHAMACGTHSTTRHTVLHVTLHRTAQHTAPTVPDQTSPRARKLHELTFSTLSSQRAQRRLALFIRLSKEVREVTSCNFSSDIRCSLLRRTYLNNRSILKTINMCSALEYSWGGEGGH